MHVYLIFLLFSMTQFERTQTHNNGGGAGAHTHFSAHLIKPRKIG